jgi:hypothetical protein
VELVSKPRAGKAIQPALVVLDGAFATDFMLVSGRWRMSIAKQ